MTREHYALLDQAITEQRTVTLRYYAPKRGGVVQRSVRAYEISRNRAGHPVLWGTDSIHGPYQIHGFLLARIVTVVLGPRAKRFEKEEDVSQHLVNEGAMEEEE